MVSYFSQTCPKRKVELLFPHSFTENFKDLPLHVTTVKSNFRLEYLTKRRVPLLYVANNVNL